MLLEAKAVHTGRSARRPPARRWQPPTASAAPRRRGHRHDRPARASPASGSAASRSAWASASASPPPCSATRTTLILDEPVNGLDPEGVLWVRNCCGSSPREGRTVLPVLAPDERDGAHRRPHHRHRARPDHRRRPRRRHHRPLQRHQRAPSAPRTPTGWPRCCAARTSPCTRRSRRRTRRSPAPPPRSSARPPPRPALVLHELAPHRGSLEDSYMSLTADAVEYHASGGHRRRPDRPGPPRQAPP